MNNSTVHTEKELFALIAQGDEEAFKQLYTTLKPMLFGFIFKLTKSREAVREIVQESLFRLWVSRHKLPEILHPRIWFFKLVSNECYRYFRKHGLQTRLKFELQQHAAGNDHAYTTETELSYRETRRIIQQSVAILSPRQREIYQLSRDRGLKIAEIAAHLGLSEKYVKKTLMLALYTLRQRLRKAGKYLTYP